MGAVVQNVETLANIAAAAEGRPVTHKTITIAGAVAEPVSFEVPLGISLRECIAAAGDPRGGARKGVRVTYLLDGKKVVKVFPYQGTVKLE